MALRRISNPISRAPLFVGSGKRISYPIRGSIGVCERWKSGARGFSLIEIIIVMGIVAMIGGVGLFFGMDSFKSYSFHSDRDLLISALQHARSEAVGNICLGTSGTCDDGRPHGVAIQAGKFVLFQGVSYATRDVSVDATLAANTGFSYSGLGEIVFSQLSATTTGGTITVTESTGRTSTITIGTEGQIIWTN